MQFISKNASEETLRTDKSISRLWDSLPRLFWSRAYLLLVAPAILILCFVIAPFNVADEPAHFLRTVQLAHGSVLPVIGPAGDSSGSIADSAVAALAHEWDRDLAHTRDPSTKMDDLKLRAMLGVRVSGEAAYTAHSNTAIYFPLAHAAPALATAIASAVGAPPLAWLYVGRLANALVAIYLFAMILRRAKHSQLAFFVIAAVPMCMFETASLSVDALLLPAACVLAWTLSEFIDRGDLSLRELLAMSLASLFVCVNKFAYIPLALLPPLITFIQHRRASRAVVFSIVSACVIIGVWGTWAFLVKDAVFTIRDGVVINTNEQLQRIIRDPMQFVLVLGRSFSEWGSYYLSSMVGRHLGWGEVKIPQLFILPSALLLFFTLFLDQKQRQISLAYSATITLMCCGCILAIFLLIYMQYNAVGAPVIDGVQGRYFLPLLPLLAIALPKWKIPRWSQATAVLLAWALLSSSTTVNLVTARYWHLVGY